MTIDLEMSKPLYIFDLDGTLANCEHRLHHLRSKSWDRFFDECIYDTPIHAVINTMAALYWSGAEIWVFSGRSDRVRAQTLEWLFVHTHMSPARVTENFLTMRQHGDYRHDDIVKREMLDNMLDIDRERLVAIFDDRDRVVAMWREAGVTCFQVAPGDF